LFRLFRLRFALGTVAFAAVIAIYWLMVAKVAHLIAAESPRRQGALVS
jgi:hypothetical protein